MRDALYADPSIVPKIRLLSIASNIRVPGIWGGFPAGQWQCDAKNWNSDCRDDIFNEFPSIWWIENDWAYTAMFQGLEERPSILCKNEQ